MWAVAAQPRTGLTPMIPTPSVDSDIAGTEWPIEVRAEFAAHRGPLLRGRYICICKQNTVGYLHRQVDRQRDVSGLLDPPTPNNLPGGRGLEAWHSLLQAHATLMRQ